MYDILWSWKRVRTLHFLAVEDAPPISSTHTIYRMSARSQRIELITRGERRQRQSLERKQAIMVETLLPNALWHLWRDGTVSYVVLDAMLDTLSSKFYTRELFVQIAGHFDFHYNSDILRLGIFQAAGPIEPPIVFGFICTNGFLVSAAVRIRWRSVCIGASAPGMLLVLSSDPQQCAIIGLALPMQARIFAEQRCKWYAVGIGDADDRSTDSVLRAVQLEYRQTSRIPKLILRRLCCKL